jgi:hypothetical protein
VPDTPHDKPNTEQIQALQQPVTVRTWNVREMLAPRKTLWSTPEEVIERVIERTTTTCPNTEEGSSSNPDDTCWFALSRDDVVCDVGCGDGRVLLRWAARVSSTASSTTNDGGGSFHELPPPQSSSSLEAQQQPHNRHATTTNRPMTLPSFVGIDVDPDRIRAARDELDNLRKEGRIRPDLSVEFWCENALDCAARLRHVTVYFLYLIPRGLRIVKPLLLLGSQRPEEEEQPTDTSPSSSILRVITYMSPLDDEVPVDVDKVCVAHQPGASWPLYYYELKRRRQTDIDHGLS